MCKNICALFGLLLVSVMPGCTKQTDTPKKTIVPAAAKTAPRKTLQDLNELPEIEEIPIYEEVELIPSDSE